MAKKKTTAAAKPRNDAYTMMLFITLVAISVGCVLLYLDTSEYEGVVVPAAAKLDIPKLGTAGTTAATGAGAGTATPPPAMP